MYLQQRIAPKNGYSSLMLVAPSMTNPTNSTNATTSLHRTSRRSRLRLSFQTFFGRNLLPREIALKFQAGLPLASEKPPKFRELLLLQKEEGEPDAEINHFRALQKNLRQLNRCKIPLQKRFGYNQRFITAFHPVILNSVRQYLNDGGVPDPVPRQEMLDVLIDITRQLIESYKIIFKTIYNSGNFTFARLMPQFEKTGFRILELARLKQRIMGLRYQVLSAQQWLTINIVFQVLWTTGKSANEHEALPGISMNRTENDKTSSADLFLSLQMMQRFNLNKWPTEWQFSFDRFDQTMRTLLLIGDDDGSKLTRNLTISYCYDNRPARNERVSEAGSRGPALLINWQHLTRKVMADYMQFFHERGQTAKAEMSNRFEFLSFAEGLALVELQLECIKDEEPILSSDALEGQPCDLRIFVGFKDVYPFLHNLHYSTSGQAVGNRMVDLLAQRSAVMAEDHVSTTASVWHLQYQDKHVMKLKTQETQFTAAFKIGSLVAYGVGAEGIQKPLLGVVSRIFRPTAKTVFLDIRYIGQDAEPVLVTPDLASLAQFDQQGKNVMYAIATLDVQNGPVLLLPPHSYFVEKDTLVLKRVKEQQLIVMGKLLSVTKSYFCYAYAEMRQKA